MVANIGFEFLQRKRKPGQRSGVFTYRTKIVAGPRSGRLKVHGAKKRSLWDVVGRYLVLGDLLLVDGSHLCEAESFDGPTARTRPPG